MYQLATIEHSFFRSQ